MNPIKPSTETPVPTVSLGLSAYSQRLASAVGVLGARSCQYCVGLFCDEVCLCQPQQVRQSRWAVFSRAELPHVMQPLHKAENGAAVLQPVQAPDLASYLVHLLAQVRPEMPLLQPRGMPKPECTSRWMAATE